MVTCYSASLIYAGSSTYSAAAPLPGASSMPHAYGSGDSSRGTSNSYDGYGGYGQQQQHPQPAPGGRLGDAAPDVFADLAPALRGSIPTVAAPTPNQYRAPPPTPQAVPMPTTKAAPSASPGGAAAAATLYGGNLSLSAMPYDLTAPAAPKPKASGNPFA